MKLSGAEYENSESQNIDAHTCVCVCAGARVCVCACVCEHLAYQLPQPHTLHQEVCSEVVSNGTEGNPYRALLAV